MDAKVISELVLSPFPDLRFSLKLAHIFMSEKKGGLNI